MAEKIYVAVYDTNTGYIKQVVRCLDTDSEMQHQRYADHDFIVIPDFASPREYMVDLVTKELVTRVAPQDEIDAIADSTARTNAVASITGGFTSSALGSANHYPSNLVDQTNMIQAALAGGGLLMVQQGDNWSLQAHDADQAKQVLQDFVTFRDGIRTTLYGEIN